MKISIQRGYTNAMVKELKSFNQYFFKYCKIAIALLIRIAPVNKERKNGGREAKLGLTNLYKKLTLLPLRYI